MRVIVKGSQLKAAAYAGTYVVVLAWDTLDGKMPSRTDLLGYAIERTEFDVAGNEIERYWMRGIKRMIGSQAYAREFGNREPDAENPRSKEMRWLSRGLFEALVRFIGLAGDGMALRAALYEFHYQPVANAFAKAIQAGADVKIVYDAES